MSHLNEHIEEQAGTEASVEVSGSANAPPAPAPTVGESGTGGVVECAASERPVSTAQETQRGDAERAPSAEPSAAPSPPPAKKTGAETLNELVKAIRSMQADFSIAMEGVRASHALVQRVDRQRQLVDQAALDALVRIHVLTDKHLQAHSREAADPTSFAYTIRQLVEGEFEYLGVKILRPSPDEPVDYGTMEAIGTAPCRVWQKPGRVAEVERCGFALQTQDGFRVLHKAKVVVRNRGAREESGA